MPSNRPFALYKLNPHNSAEEADAYFDGFLWAVGQHSPEFTLAGLGLFKNKEDAEAVLKEVQK